VLAVERALGASVTSMKSFDVKAQRFEILSHQLAQCHIVIDK
jgi:hypothetical protein